MPEPCSPDPSLVDALHRYERLVAEALTARDPAAAFEAAARDPGLTPELRRCLAGADPRGVRMSALLIVRLRFERLLQGSPRASEWFERDPASFARAFREYHHAVAPRATDPRTEARAFETWWGGASISRAERPS